MVSFYTGLCRLYCWPFWTCGFGELLEGLKGQVGLNQGDQHIGRTCESLNNRNKYELCVDVCAHTCMCMCVLEGGGKKTLDSLQIQ